MVSSSPQPFKHGPQTQDSHFSENTVDSSIGSQAGLPSWTALEEPHISGSEGTTSDDNHPVPQSLQHSPHTPRSSATTARGTGHKNGTSKAASQIANGQRTLPSFFGQRGDSASAGPSTSSQRIRPAPSGGPKVRFSPATAIITSGASIRPPSASGKSTVVRFSPFKASNNNLADVIDGTLRHNGPPQQVALPADATSRATASHVGPVNADADADSDIEEIHNPHVGTIEDDAGEMDVSGLSPVRRTTNPNVPRPQRNDGNSIIDALSAVFEHNQGSGTYTYAQMAASASASAFGPPRPKPKPQSKRPRSLSNPPGEPLPKKAHIEDREQQPERETEPARPTRLRRGDAAARTVPPYEMFASDLVDRALDTRILTLTFRPDVTPAALVDGALMQLPRRAIEVARAHTAADASRTTPTHMQTEAQAQKQKQTIPRWSEAGRFKCRLDTLFGRGSMLRGFGARPVVPPPPPPTAVHTRAHHEPVLSPTAQEPAGAAAVPAPEDEEAGSQTSFSTVFIDIEGDEDPETMRIKATRQSSMARSQQLEPRQPRSRG